MSDAVSAANCSRAMRTTCIGTVSRSTELIKVLLRSNRGISAFRRAFSFSIRLRASARSTAEVSSSGRKGLRTNSYTPRRIASIAVSRVPNPVITTEARSGQVRWICS